MDALIPPRLKPGDGVRLVSPASPPTRHGVERAVQLFTSWGLEVEVADHVFDELGHYLAGTDEDRLADLNDALGDPGVRAVFATRGGKGAYRIVEGVDFEAARRDPKPLVGFSDITILHLGIWKRSRVAGLHGPLANWDDAYCGPESAEALRRALMTTEPIVLTRNPEALTAAVRVEGKATGFLMGGNLDMVAMAVGAGLPDLAGAILLIESTDLGLGRADRALTQLMNAGCLAGIAGVAVGQFLGYREAEPGRWTIVDVLVDRLTSLGVPVLGGLPIGHGWHPPTVPLGTRATIDTDAGTLSVDAGVS